MLRVSTYHDLILINFELAENKINTNRNDGQNYGHEVKMVDSLLWQVVPLYPGAHSQVPSSGEQDAPFLQLQGREQLGPQRPSAHTLSQ